MHQPPAQVLAPTHAQSAVVQLEHDDVGELGRYSLHVQQLLRGLLLLLPTWTEVLPLGGVALLLHELFARGALVTTPLPCVWPPWQDL